DCDMPVDGAAAFVLTNAERARDLPAPPAYVTGYAQGLTRRTATVWTLEEIYEGGKELSRLLWERTGLGPGDIRAPQLYDGFSAFVYWWLETLGFCAPGEAFEFIQGGRIAPDGELPLN